MGPRGGLAAQGSLLSVKTGPAPPPFAQVMDAKSPRPLVAGTQPPRRHVGPAVAGMAPRRVCDPGLWSIRDKTFLGLPSSRPLPPLGTWVFVPTIRDLLLFTSVLAPQGVGEVPCLPGRSPDTLREFYLRSSLDTKGRAVCKLSRYGNHKKINQKGCVHFFN